MKKALSLTALLLVFAAVPASAQAPAIELNGYGGVYLPVADLAEAEDVEGLVTFSQSTAVIFGGRVTVWVTPVFGVEGGFGYALSDVEVEADGVDLCEEADALGLDVCDATVWTGSLKGLYRFVPMPDAIWAIHVGGGVALIGHSGDFWDDIDVDGTTDIGGVLNVGAIFDVASQVAIRLDLEDYLYSAKFEDPDTGEETDAEFQNDLVFSGGIVIKLGGGM